MKTVPGRSLIQANWYQITISVSERDLVFLTSWVSCMTGTPEAIGKAELLDSIARGMSRWQGFSIGLSKQLAWLDGSLHKRQAAIHQVMESAGPDELNFILAHNNCATMLEVAAEKTIDLLTDRDQRLRDLNTLSRWICWESYNAACSKPIYWFIELHFWP